MANPAVTYTFANASTADATQVNQNFTDLINSLTDGTKSLTIAALTAGGTATLSGAVTLGSATDDDITVNGSLASSIPIKTTNSYDIGTATIGLKYIYFGQSASTYTAKLLAPTLGSSVEITLPSTTGTLALSVNASPTGAIVAYPAATAPTGWLLCDGSAVSRTTYATLFAIIGCAYGVGDASTTFNLPDFRGRFLRAFDSSAALDPNNTTRTAMVSSTHTLSCTTTNTSPTVTTASTANLAAGMTVSGTGIPASTVIRSITNSTTFVLGNLGNSADVNATASATNTLTFSKASTGNYVGSVQATATAAPTTAFSGTTATQQLSRNPSGGSGAFGSGTYGLYTTANEGTHTHTFTVTAGGDSESRPLNAYVTYLIKY